MPFITFLGITNKANPLVVLDFAHPNMEQFAPGILLVNKSFEYSARKENIKNS